MYLQDEEEFCIVKNITTRGFEVSLTFKTASIGKTAKKSYVHVYQTPKNYPLNCGKGQF